MKLKKKIIILLILIPLLIFFWPISLGGDTGYMIVFGNSMLPTIQPGSFVITKSATNYFVDDIVSFQQTEQGVSKNIVHRIISEQEDGFILKGDNNKNNDPGIINSDNITGRVFLVIPYVGAGIEFLRNPLILALVGISILVVQSGRKKANHEEMSLKKSKSQYGLFISAIIVNCITYVIVQLSLSLEIKPKSDIFTNFLFKIFEPSFASTIVFVMYFFMVLTMYMFAKNGGMIQTKFVLQKGMIMLEKPNYVMLGVQFFLFLYIMIAMIQLMSSLQVLMNGPLEDLFSFI